MNPAALLMPKVRLRTELIVIGVVLVSVLCLPVAAMASLTDLPSLATDDSLKLYTGVGSKENLYDFGYCTFWASKRRAEVGFPIPQHWGDAHSWDDNAILAGYRVDHTPVKYAIMQTDAGALGHVAFVESVEPDGTWTISEMNYKGWDIMSGRTLTAADALNYNFIH